MKGSVWTPTYTPAHAARQMEDNMTPRYCYILRHATGYQMGRWLYAVNAYDALADLPNPSSWQVVRVARDPLEHLLRR
jgi:hypothetical protein